MIYEISSLYLTLLSKVEISSLFVAFLEKINFITYLPVLQIANQDSEMIYYVYGMIAKLFVLSL